MVVQSLLVEDALDSSLLYLTAAPIHVWPVPLGTEEAPTPSSGSDEVGHRQRAGQCACCCRYHQVGRGTGANASTPLPPQYLCLFIFNLTVFVVSFSQASRLNSFFLLVSALLRLDFCDF